MTPSQKYLKKIGLKDPEPIENANTANTTDTNENSRRDFLKKSTLGGVALGGALMFSPIEEIIARSTQNVRRFSGPSDLKITDMRYA
ncbi:MAG: twin-arginine translocation signal domain-containing protein, partial [Bacteroidota bacterium]